MAVQRLRLLGHLWALPITLLGGMQALAGGARLASVSSDGIFSFVAGRRGPIAWWMRRNHVSAYTWGAVITYADQGGLQDPLLVTHEREHVTQTFWLGPC